MTDQLTWYIARGSGIIAWAMMALGIFWGLALSTRFLGRRPKPNWMLDLHRFLGGAAMVFTAVHAASLLLDSYVTFDWIDVLVPYATDYQPAAVAWGVIGIYLLLAVEVTSVLRKHLSKRAWRMTHMLSYPLFAVSTAHLMLIGTDRSTVLLRSSVLVVTTAIAISTLVRVLHVDRSPRRPSTHSFPPPRIDDPGLVRVPVNTGR